MRIAPIAARPLYRTSRGIWQLEPISHPSRTRSFFASPPSREKGNDRIAHQVRLQTESNGFPATMASTSKEKKAPPSVPRPSSSVLLISPQNQVLLLQRVKQSSSFPSAHVFPGGNVSPFHDGDPPPPEDPARHFDSPVYRMAAIRETFEESGILLARNNGFGRLLEVPDAERAAGRNLVHADGAAFPTWLAQKGGRADVDGLLPFTRWLTPPTVPRRFTTQMYLYFLPTLADAAPLLGNGSSSEGADAEAEVTIPAPTTDGGKEHTTARFLPAATWCRLAQEGRIILFPPQFFLLHQVAQFLDALPTPTAYSAVSRDAVARTQLEARRKALVEFVKAGAPPWTEMCICPTVQPPRGGKRRADGRSILGLHRPGPELQGSERKGVVDQCVLVEFKKEGPRRLSVISREEAMNGDESKL
nr:putative nudix hydrolase 7 [Quercus suber]